MGHQIRIRELLAWDGPRAVAVNISVILLTLSVIPTEKLSLLPVRSLYEMAGITTYSSGMMRGLSLILHGKFPEAWAMNPLSYLTLAVMLALLIRSISGRIPR